MIKRYLFTERFYESPFEALENTWGTMLYRTVDGRVEAMDGGPLLLRFAADQALKVAHLWDMPDIVREYLTTLDKRIRVAAKKTVDDLPREGPYINAIRTASAVFQDRADSSARDATYMSAVILSFGNNDKYKALYDAAGREFNRRVDEIFERRGSML